MPRRFAPRQLLTISQKAQFGGVFWTMFELFLNKIQNKSVCFRPPPLRFGGTKTDKFSLHFLIFSRPIFSFKRKRKFFCFVFLLIREKRKRSILNRKRAKIPSPRPSSFLPFCFSGFARFFSAGWLQIKRAKGGLRIKIFINFFYNVINRQYIFWRTSNNAIYVFFFF